MNEYDDGEWHVFELVPDLIVAHTGIRAGEPVIKGTRVPTFIAASAFEEGRWRDYRITKEQAFAAVCFEAGMEYRKMRRKIDKLVDGNWENYNRKHYPQSGT